MTHIFYHNTEILLSEHTPPLSENTISFAELKKKGADHFLKVIEYKNITSPITILGESSEEMLGYFRDHLTEITAGGGLVQNPDDEILFIFRNGKWDLPKGKPEKNENIKETALREVEEECGITGLEIVGTLPETYHIYPLATSGYVLKKSVWFHMRTFSKQPLKAQTEEGITEVRWIGIPVENEILTHAFPSIRSLVEYFSGNYLRGRRS
ncbi:MAG: NUDIX domain-containing protein [Bacteroidetes bacterium]|nr:MAG: NUDIX domain-containing protein [Bacteroidota bacterium]